MSALYAPKSATRIAEAAQLIRQVCKLLDGAGDNSVMAEIEKIEGAEYIDTDLARRLDTLADSMDGEAA